MTPDGSKGTTMDDWSKKWNKMPQEIRHIGAAVNTEMRIQQLNDEKRRLKNRYRQSLNEVNGHIANLEEWLRRMATTDG